MGNITGKPTIGVSQVTNAGTTSNDADEALDLALTDTYTAAVTGSNTFTITDVAGAYNFTRNSLFHLTASGVTAPAAILVPAVKKGMFAVKNSLGFDATVAISGQSEAPDTVPAGTSAMFTSDGVNVRIAGGGGAGIDTLEALTDVDTLVGVPNGYVLARKAGPAAEWIAQSAGAAGDALPFALSPSWRGAKVGTAANITGLDIREAVGASYPYYIPWNTESEDTDGFHDNATNNTRLTIPAGSGITRIRLHASVLSQLHSSGDFTEIRFLKNRTVNILVSRDSESNTDRRSYATSGVIPCVEGDYFEVYYATELDSSITLTTGELTTFQIEVVETTDTVPSLRTVVVSTPHKYRGAVVHKNGTDQSVASGGPVKATWSAAEVDTDSLFDNTNDRLVIPAGVKTVRLRASTRWAIDDSVRIQRFRKNGSETFVGNNYSQENAGTDTANHAFYNETARLSVVQGDYFELWVDQSGAANLDLLGSAAQTWFEMEIVEFNSSTDAPVAYIAIPPEHKGALLARSAVHSIPDAAEETLPWQVATYNDFFEVGDGGPVQRFWLGVNTSFVDGDVTVGTDVIAETAHGYQTGEGPVQLTSSGTLPTGLALATNYWFIRVDANSYKFASSRANALAGTAVDITVAAGGGTHTVNHETKLIVPANVAKVVVKGSVEMAAGTTPVNRYLTIHKNGAVVQGVMPSAIDDGDVAGWLHAETNTLVVAEGDVFELIALQDSAGAVNVNNNAGTNFSIEVIEEARAITYPGVTVTPPWRGARIGKTTDQISIGTAQVEVTFDESQVDTDGIVDLPNNALVVPAGVLKVRLRAQAHILNAGTVGGAFLDFRKNDATMNPRGHVRFQRDEIAADTAIEIFSATLDVVQGDSFIVIIQITVDATADVSDQTWFEMEIVETNEAAFPPESLKAHVTTVDRLVVSSTVAMWLADRRLSLADDFAGSLGYATNGPNGGAVVFDVQVEGGSIGSITFADSTGAAQTATFATAGAAVEVINAGERLEIIAPANIQSMDDVAFTLSAWRS